MLNVVYYHRIFAVQKYGGISRYFYELAIRMGRFDGIVAKIYAPVHINQYLRNSPADLVWGRYLPHIPKLTKARNVLNDILSLFYLRKLSKNSPSHLFHETYYSQVRLAQVKTVITVYDMIHEKFAPFFPRHDRTSEVKSRAINNADHVICISERTRHDLLETSDVNPDKVSVVHLASSLTCENNGCVHEDNKRKHYILYVGARAGYKNFQRLLASYACSKRLMSDFKLVCFGGGAFTRSEENEIRILNIPRKNIELVSGNDSVLAACYRDAAAFVYPSLYEGFGIPLLEAMNCFCPVICSNTGSFSEVAGDAAEYFDPEETDSIVLAMESVLYSKARTRSLVESGVKRRQCFSWDNCAEQTAAIYRTLASTRHL